MLTVTKRFLFEYAHRLPNYQGDCCNVHGHRGVCLVTVGGFKENATGMIVDFKKLKNDIGPIIQELDHAFLNDFIENPTAENITMHIVNKIKDTDIFYKGNLQRVRVYETEDCYAEWRRC